MPAFRPAPQDIASVVYLAWIRAHEIMNSRDGAGFIFKVYTSAGIFEGPPPSDHTGPTSNGVLELEVGSGLFIRQGDIVAIEVVEC